MLATEPFVVIYVTISLQYYCSCAFNELRRVLNLFHLFWNIEHGIPEYIIIGGWFDHVAF